MLKIEVDIEHLKEMIDDLQEIVGSLDPKPLLEDAGAFLLNRVRTRFLAEQDPEGNAWPPSKAALKRRTEGGTGTLYDTGTLFKSIQFANTAEDEASVGTDVEYAPYLHYGFKHWKTKKKIGPWPFLGVSVSDAETIELILIKRIEDHIEENLRDEY